MTLKFSPKAHRYWLDGKSIPGVTSLLKGGIPAPQLIYWAARTVAEFVADNDAAVEQMRTMGRGPMVAALKETPWQARDEAGARGTEIHALGERIVHGEQVDVPAHLTGYLDGYVRFLDEWQLEPVLTEVSVANRKHWYAGRLDLIADIRGTRWLLDLKSAKGIYSDNALQCDAYRNAEFYVADGDPDTELALPEGIERIGAIHIRDEVSELVPLESNGQPFKDFLHASWLAKRKDLRDTYVGEPLQPSLVSA